MRIFRLALIGLLLTALSCSRSQEGGERAQARPAGPIPVDVYRVPAPRDIPLELTYPARLKGTGEVTIVARVSGIVEGMFFKEGEPVRKGALLFRIEPDIYRIQVEGARAALNEALARLKKAERDWKRVSRAFKEGVISKRDRDQALYSYEIAKASVEAARARLKKAQIDLGYTDVKATISGRTGMRLVDVGDMVNPGTPLVRITTIDPIYAEFSLPDTDLLRYGLTQKMSEVLEAEIMGEGWVYGKKGRVEFIDARVDESTSSVRARAVFPNPDGRLLPGEFVRIRIRGLVKKGAVEIPQRAVIQTPLGTRVFVVERGKAVPRSVKVGEERGENFIVEGLKEGEMVIVSNLMKVRPNAPVRVTAVVNEG